MSIYRAFYAILKYKYFSEVDSYVDKKRPETKSQDCRKTQLLEDRFGRVSFFPACRRRKRRRQHPDTASRVHANAGADADDFLLPFRGSRHGLGILRPVCFHPFCRQHLYQAVAYQSDHSVHYALLQVCFLFREERSLSFPSW